MRRLLVVNRPGALPNATGGPARTGHYNGAAVNCSRNVHYPARRRGEVNEAALTVASSAEEMSADEIGRNVSRITDLAHGVAAQSGQAAVASQELAQLGARLRGLVTQFKL